MGRNSTSAFEGKHRVASSVASKNKLMSIKQSRDYVKKAHLLCLLPWIMSMYVHAAAMLLLGTLHVCFTLNLTLTQCVGWQALLYILQAQFPPTHILGSLHS